MPSDREFQGEQEYVFPESFQGFLQFEKSKKLKGCKTTRFFAFFYKIEFSSFVPTWII